MSLGSHNWRGKLMNRFSLSRPKIAAVPPEMRKGFALPAGGLKIVLGLRPSNLGRSPKAVRGAVARKVRDLPHIRRHSRRKTGVLASNLDLLSLVFLGALVF